VYFLNIIIYFVPFNYLQLFINEDRQKLTKKNKGRGFIEGTIQSNKSVRNAT